MSIRPKPAVVVEPLKRSFAVRTYVVAPNQDYFVEYVRQSKKNLQDCKIISNTDQCRGLSFTSPLDELVVLAGWMRKNEQGWSDEVHRLIARYCRDKRVHDVPRFTT